ncbi:MAG: transcription antitermination factor NusB [Tenuifilaceae bacterium]
MISRRLLRVKILQVLFAYFKSENDSLVNTEKELLHSIHKAFDLYHLLLYLPVELADYAENKIQLAKQKFIATHEDLNPNTKFINNKLVTLIRENESLKSYLESHKLGWGLYPEVIRNLYIRLSESDYFKSYMESSNSSFNDDKQLVINILSRELEDFDELYQHLEEQSIYWNDDLEFMLSMVVKTLKKFSDEQPTSAALFPMYRSDDDEDYAKRLMRKVVLNHTENVKLIEEYTKNWEVDRIASMDILIMELALTEIKEFPSIPIKVSFNEYIEIAKYYSTDQSSTFINGVLDKIITTLRKKNAVVKQGRGLIGEEDERLALSDDELE